MPFPGPVCCRSRCSGRTKVLSHRCQNAMAQDWIFLGGGGERSVNRLVGPLGDMSSAYIPPGRIGDIFFFFLLLALVRVVSLPT